MTPAKFPLAAYADKLPPERRDEFARFANWAPWDAVEAFIASHERRGEERLAAPVCYYQRF